MVRNPKIWGTPNVFGHSIPDKNIQVEATPRYHISFFFFLPYHMAYRILSSLMEPTPPAVETWRLNHWTTVKSLDIILESRGCYHPRPKL